MRPLAGGFVQQFVRAAVSGIVVLGRRVLESTAESEEAIVNPWIILGKGVPLDDTLASFLTRERIRIGVLLG